MPGPYAYVTDYGTGTTPGTVTPISVATGAAASAITVGIGPSAVAVTPDGTTAYVTDTGSDAVTPIVTATNKAGTPIGVGSKPDAIAITPDGTTAFVADGGGATVTPIHLSTGTAASPIPVGSDPVAVAITPDGTTAYVLDSVGTLTPIHVATDVAGAPIHIPGGDGTVAVTITPNGTTAYVANELGWVTPVTLAADPASDVVQTAIDLSGAEPHSVAVSPDGTTLYVADAAGAVIRIPTSTDVPGTPITVSGGQWALAVSPDGATVYLGKASNGTVTPVDTAHAIAGGPITVGPATSGDLSIAVMPDQGPTASLRASTTGGVTSFDASASLAGSTPIASYTWNFGDGSPPLVTPGPTTTHTYAPGACGGTPASPACLASVVATDGAGTSTTRSFTGQTMSLNGSAAAKATASVIIVTSTGCQANSTCQVVLAAPKTPTSPPQTVTVKTTTDGSAAPVLTATSAPGTLACGTTGFSAPSTITSYSATYVPTTTVTVTDVVAGVTTTKGVSICFASKTGKPFVLKVCPKTGSHVACYTSLTVVHASLKVVIAVPPGDPKFHIDGVQVATERPTAIATTAVIGKTVTIKGTGLLGTGKQLPIVMFTSPDGTTDARGTVLATSTATQIVVKVPNAAVSGPVSISWPGHTFLSQGKVVIT